MEPIRVIGGLLYGSGLRLMECLRLRIKDLDFTYGQITIRDGKGEKDRVTMLPATLRPSLEIHLKRVKLMHEEDLTAGFGHVFLPTRFPENTRVLQEIGSGNMSFRPLTCRSTREAKRGEDITSPRTRSKAR
jgi:integrase